MNVLLVEDEAKIASFVVQGLREQGFVVDHCANGNEGYDWATERDYDVVLLDIMVPGKDGLSILKDLRQRGQTMPIILLTARNELDDRLTGLNLGADDYLAKPFYVEELVARIHAVVRRTQGERQNILAFCKQLQTDLQKQSYAGSKVRVELDDRDIRGGEKAWGHIKKGVPIRVEVGPKDLAAGSLFVGRRDHAPKQKSGIPRDEFVRNIARTLGEIQDTLYQRALAYRDEHLKPINSLEEFKSFFATGAGDGANNEISGGFAAVHWNEAAIDHSVLAELKVTPRCIPLDGKAEAGSCIFTGKPSTRRVIFARNY
jgi:CheY-like chemotaxis protein